MKTSTKNIGHKILFTAAISLLSGITLLPYTSTEWLRLSPDMLADKRPFAYRILAHGLVTLVERLLPQWIIDRTQPGSIVDQICHTCHGYGLAAMIVLFLALVAATLGLYILAKEVNFSRPWRWFVVVLFCFMVMSVFRPWAKLYDLPHAALFIWGLVFLKRKDTPYYWLTYLLGLFSKDTMILLVPVYWLVYGRTLKATIQSGVQVGIAGLVKLAMLAWIGQIPTESHWRVFIENLTDFKLITQSLMIAILVAIALFGFKYKHEFIRKSFIVIPLMVVMYLLFGYPGEIRVFLEVAPVLLLAIAPASIQNAGLPSPAPGQTPTGRRAGG